MKDHKTRGLKVLYLILSGCEIGVETSLDDPQAFKCQRKNCSCPKFYFIVAEVIFKLILIYENDIMVENTLTI